ncbi:MAG: site-specific integrase [Acidobacteriota bacterium]|nr:site-specific integrase [Acidobacteriota bacterium]
MAQRTSEERIARIRREAVQFFKEAETFDQLLEEKFAARVQANVTILLRWVFLPGEWRKMQDDWIRERLRPVMNKLLKECKVQRQFTVDTIRGHVGLGKRRFLVVLGQEWRELKAKLPTEGERLAAAIDEIKNTATSLDELTLERAWERSGVTVSYKWARDYLRAARLELSKRLNAQGPPPPEGENIRLFPGGAVNLDGDVWDLRAAGYRVLRRDRLRPDLAEVAWALLRNDLVNRKLAASTVEREYCSFIRAGAFLGEAVPDVRSAKLRAVQEAWLRYDGGRAQRGNVRRVLSRLFAALLGASKDDPAIDGKEMLLILDWLRNVVRVEAVKPGEEFLSEQELDGLVAGCLSDIKAGIGFTETDPDLFNLCPLSFANDSAIPVVRWGVALMLLVSAFTGLRTQSVIRLREGDLIEVRPGLFALVWRHTKTMKESVCVLPTVIARHIRLYVERTRNLRALLETDAMFLNGGKVDWGPYRNANQVVKRYRDFARRHRVERDGTPLALNNMTLRRTYATRELYEGRSLWVIRLQLGHARIVTTEIYTKFDRYEHPALVREALDEYGRKSLTLWRSPVLLDGLSEGERASLLGAAAERHQDVGLCREDRCVKAAGGNPLPCTLCEYLVTGPEFLGTWEEERLRLEGELRRLEGDPAMRHVLAQKRALYRQFLANMHSIKERGVA